MSVIKSKKYLNGFTTIPNETIHNREISYEALGLWLYIMSKPSNWEVRTADLRNRATRREFNPKTFEDKSGRKAIEGEDYMKTEKGIKSFAGRDYIQNILNELKELGLAKLESERDESTGALKGKTWIISDIPHRLPEKASIGNREPENTDDRKNRQSENPTVGKSGHIVKTDLIPNTDSLENKDSTTTTARERLDQLIAESKEKEKVAAAVNVETSINVEPTEKEKLKMIVAAIDSSDSAYIEKAKMICQQKGMSYQDQLNDYALYLLLDVKFPIGIKESSELKKRFWLSLNKQSGRPISLPKTNRESTPIHKRKFSLLHGTAS